MLLYFAPLEGITTYTYRNTHNEMFGGCDAYFAPFITPTTNERLSLKNLRDIIPEKNTVNLKAQVLVNEADAFLDFERRITGIGYDEVNINLGCPSGTVAKKKRGVAFLKDTDALDKFLNEIFEKSKLRISVKSRIGFYSHDEFDEILRVYNKYPISELIIHPRVREDYYSGIPDMKAFSLAYETSPLKLCYNGDVYNRNDFEKIISAYPNLSAVMIGRGAVKNPALFRELKGGACLTTEEIIKFSDTLEERYLKVLESEKYTMNKLKEIWLYMMDNYPEEKKIFKAVKKSVTLADLKSAVYCLPEI